MIWPDGESYSLGAVEDSEHINGIELSNIPMEVGYTLHIDVDRVPEFNAIVGVSPAGDGLNATDVDIGSDPELWIDADIVGQVDLLLLEDASLNCLGQKCSASDGDLLETVTVEVKHD